MGNKKTGMRNEARGTRKTNTAASLAAKGLAEKAGPGLPSGSPIPGVAGFPSGGAAPKPRGGSDPIMGTRPDVGHAHEQVGMGGAHAMEVPGMPSAQGGTRNPNRVSSSGGQVPNSTPEPNNLRRDAEPTNPRYQPEPNQGSGVRGQYPDGQPGRPPQSAPLDTPDPNHPMGRLPNNPRGETTVPTERTPRARMY